MISKENVEMEKICRSCMSESTQMRNVFEIKKADEENSLQLAEMLMACTSIQISSDDGLPVQLCQACETKLDTAFEFKRQCEKTDTTLRQLSNLPHKSPCKYESLNIVVQPDLGSLDISNGDISDSSDPVSTATKYSKTSVAAAAYICSYCQKVLRTKKGLVFHQRRHTGEQLRCCHICPAKFTRSNHLKRHLLLHNKSSYAYSKKQKKSEEEVNDNKSKSDQHHNNEDDDTDIETGFDDPNDEDYRIHRKKKFKKERDIEDKNKNKENEKEKQVIMQCEFCDRKFKYKKSFLHHMQLEHEMPDEGDVHSDPSPTDVSKLEKTVVKTEVTQEFLSGVNSLEAQSSDEEKFGLDDDPDSAIPVTKGRQYTCHVCNVEFTRANHLTRHMTIHRAVLTHKCDKCEKAFLTSDYLLTHVQEDHINKPYVCTICEKPFSRGEQFIRHLSSHNTTSTDDNHKCSICDKIFTRSDHLARHIKTHLQQDKRHVCSDCGKAFNRLDNLKTHKRIHSGLKDASRSHLCVYCGKDFNSSSNMIVHMRRHTGERPYKCSICNKGFPRSHDLKCHERTHSGEKPYLCTLCGKSFNKSNKLLRHTRVHTGERPYVCSICGRAFTQSNDLALHMRRHTGARPYVCGVCPARFIQSGQLKAHRRSTNHWMDIPPDLKGGHRVEQVTPILNPAPIKFKTHGRSELKFKEEEMFLDIKDEPRNIIQQVNIMGIDDNLAVNTPPYVNERPKLIHSSTGTGYLVFTSMLNSAIQDATDVERYKADMQSSNTTSIHNVDAPVNNSKLDITSNTVTFSSESSAPSYSVIPTEQYNYENYG